MLWLLRHADAEDPDGRPDAERPLTEKGRAQARAAGAALAALGVPLDACLASPRVRARDTALLACESLGLEVQIAPELAGGRFDPERVAAGFGADVLLVGSQSRRRTGRARLHRRARAHEEGRARRHRGW